VNPGEAPPQEGRSFECPACARPIAIETFLASVRGYRRATRSGVSPCPACGKDIEFQIRTGTLSIGYIYSSGAPHFESLFDVEAPGIHCEVGERGVAFVHGGKRHEIPDSGGASG